MIHPAIATALPFVLAMIVAVIIDTISRARAWALRKLARRRARR